MNFRAFSAAFPDGLKSKKRLGLGEGCAGCCYEIGDKTWCSVCGCYPAQRDAAPPPPPPEPPILCTVPTPPATSPPPPAPSGLRYFPSFITPEAEDLLASQSKACPGWVNLPHSDRSVLALSLLPGGSWALEATSVPVPAPFSLTLTLLAAALKAASGLSSNHALINLYPSRNMTILPHTDGPCYEPTTATVTCLRGAALCFEERKEAGEVDGTGGPPKTFDTWMQRGSAVVFRGSWYERMLHSVRMGRGGGEELWNGIEEVGGGERLSATFRFKRGRE